MTDVIDGVAEIAFLLRPEHGAGAPLTARDKARSALVSEFTAADYRAFAARYENFYAVRETATGRIAAFRWLYGPNDPADARDPGTALIRELFGAVHVGKQIGVHPDYRGLGFGVALVNWTMNRLKADVYNVVLRDNDKSMEFHMRQGYEPLHNFTSNGHARTIFVKRYRPSGRTPAPQ